MMEQSTKAPAGRTGGGDGGRQTTARVCAPRSPVPTGPGRPVPTWSVPSLALLTVTATVLLGAALWHLAMVFLSIAPPSPVQRTYAHVIKRHVQPEFSQDWQLFAPQPLQANVRVEARTRTAGGSGARRTGRWTSLTAQDVAGVRNSLLPSHADQNLLRRAWDFYQDTHNRREAAIDARGALSAEYLKRIALSRLAHGNQGAHGERIIALQMRSRSALIPPPHWSGRPPVRNTRLRTLPWWPVTGDAHAPYQAALFRIGLGGIVAAFLLREWPHRRLLYGDRSPWAPDMAARVIEEDHRFSVLLWSGSHWWFELVYHAAIVAAVLLVLGWRTRGTSVVFLVAVLSIESRNTYLGDAGDNAMRVMALDLAFTRWGALWSLDAHRRVRARQHGKPVYDRRSCGRSGRPTACGTRRTGGRGGTRRGNCSTRPRRCCTTARCW